MINSEIDLPAITEGVGPSKDLFQKAKNSGITFGFECEFLLTGVHTVLKNLVYKNSDRNLTGDTVKTIKDLTYYDIVMHFELFDFSESELLLPDDELLPIRLEKALNNSDIKFVNLVDGWESLVKKHGAAACLNILKVVPTYGFASSEKNDILALLRRKPSSMNFHNINKFNSHKVIIFPEDTESLDLSYKNGATFTALSLFLADKLTTYFGHKVVVNSNPDNNAEVSDNYSYWILTSDSSIKPDDGYNSIGFELISPKMPLSESLEQVKKAFDLLKNFGKTIGAKILTASTNESTGFHMNFGNVGKIDYIKLIALYNDNYLIRKFDREKSIHTIPIRDVLISHINTRDDAFNVINKFEQSVPLTTQDFNYAVKILSMFAKDKFHSMNLSKLKKYGFIEFREIGNTDYHEKYTDIQQIIVHIGSILYIATNPNVYKNEYLTKIFRIIKSIDISNVNASNPMQQQDIFDMIELKPIIDEILYNPLFSASFKIPLTKKSAGRIEEILTNFSMKKGINKKEYSNLISLYVSQLQQNYTRSAVKTYTGADIKNLFLLMQEIKMRVDNPK